MAVPARSRLYRVSQLIDNAATAYSQGQAMGSKFTVAVQNTPGRGIFLHRIRVVDGENNTVNDMKINIFTSDFTATADGSTWAVANAADAKNYAIQVAIAHSDFAAISTKSWAEKDVSKALYISDSSLHFQCQADGAIDTTAGSTFTISFIYERLA